MLFKCVAEHEYIIKIHMDEPSNVLSQYHRYELLECGGGIAVSLLHDLTQECTEDSRKGCLLNIFWLHTYLFICLSSSNILLLQCPS